MTGFAPLATPEELWLICQLLGLLLAVTVLVAAKTGRCDHGTCRNEHTAQVRHDRERRKLEDDKINHRMWHQDTVVKSCRVCTGAREEEKEDP